MRTFVVRVFDADDLDDLDGFLEEPALAVRAPFHGADDLISRLRRASGGHADRPKAIEMRTGSIPGANDGAAVDMGDTDA